MNMAIKRGIDKAVEAVTAELETLAKPTRDQKEIAQVGTISANSDATIGNIIAEAMVPDEDRPAVLEHANRVLKGEAVPFEHRIIHKDGSIRYIRNTPVPHWDHDGVMVSYDGIINDITESKLAEAEITRLSLHDGLTGLPNRILYMPMAAAEMPCQASVAQNATAMVSSTARWRSAPVILAGASVASSGGLPGVSR